MRRHATRRYACGLALVSAFAFTSLCDVSSAHAQSDVQLWVSARVRFDLPEGFRLSLDQQVRFDEDVSRLSEVIPELRVGYKVAKWLRLAAGYRFIYARDDGGDFEEAHRVHFDVRFRGDLDPVRIGYRLRFQDRIEDEGSSRDNRLTLRNRLGIRVDTDTLFTPSLSAEVFSRLNGDKATAVRKWRITVGGSFDLDDHELGFFYRVQVPVDQGDDPTLHIFGLEYQLNVDLD